MNAACRRIRTTLTEEGPRILREDLESQDHVVSCGDCFELFDALEHLEGLLERLPAQDASDALVARVLEKSGACEPSGDPSDATPPTRFLRLRLGWALGSALAACLSLALVLTLRTELEDRVPEGVGRHPPLSELPSVVLERAEPQRSAAIAVPRSNPAAEWLELPPEASFTPVSGSLAQVSADTRVSDPFINDLPVPGRSYTNVVTMAPGVVDADGDGDPNVHGARSRGFSAMVGGARDVDPLTGQKLSDVNPNTIEERVVITGDSGVAFGRASGGFAAIVPRGPDSDAARRRARAFLDARESVEGLHFLEAEGHWANTYLPGDPLLRLLEARLLAAAAPLPVARLHGAARPAAQPFDAPHDAALGLYLASDRAAVHGRTRMLVQVGLQATPIRGSRRPSMNVAVVLDLRGELSQESAASMRAVVEALRQARDPGDRFCLYVGGRAGARVAGPDELRHGFLSVVLAGLLGEGEPLQGLTLDLLAALRAAQHEVWDSDDPTRPLGSSAVLLVTSQGLGPTGPTILELARAGALEGVTTSAVAVGAGAEPSDLRALALAGQGSLHVLANAAEAADVVGRELSAVSRVVARAVRLRIRLASGVRLVDVLGSDWLDEERAQFERRVQKSLDRRVAQDLGITRDRERDEDGIQILIPNFYSGDSHVVLLDVVAEGPGPVVEVQARFKDLVELRNGVSRVSLDLGRSERRPGPLEHGVLKSLLAVELAACLERSGRAAAAGDRRAAAAMLDDFGRLLTGLRLELPELAVDSDLRDDALMLAAYGDALTAADPPLLAWLADSLRYAARLEVLPGSRSAAAYR